MTFFLTDLGFRRQQPGRHTRPTPPVPTLVCDLSAGPTWNVGSSPAVAAPPLLSTRSTRHDASRVAPLALGARFARAHTSFNCVVHFFPTFSLAVSPRLLSLFLCCFVVDVSAGSTCHSSSSRPRSKNARHVAATVRHGSVQWPSPSRDSTSFRVDATAATVHAVGPCSPNHSRQRLLAPSVARASRRVNAVA